MPGEGNAYPLQYSCLRNPRAEEPGRLLSMGSQRLDTNDDAYTQSSPEDEKLQRISQHSSYLDGLSATSHPNPYLYPCLSPNTDFQTLT